MSSKARIVYKCNSKYGKKALMFVCLNVISVETTLILVLCCLIDIVATIIPVPWQTCKLLVKIDLITRQLENPL